LPNGLRVLALPDPTADIFTAQVLIRAGSVFEDDSTSGATHLLEHLLFADGAADEMAETSGFILDGSTAREFMWLRAIGKGDKWKMGVASLARLLREPDWGALAKESSVIAEESKLASLGVDEKLQRSLWYAACKTDAWKRMPMGEAPPKIPVATLREIYGRRIVGPNIVAVLAGPFKSEEAIRELSDTFSFVATGTPAVPPLFEISTPQVIYSETEKLAVAVRSPALDNPRRWLAHEALLEICANPKQENAKELLVSKFSAPSSSGSLSVLVFDLEGEGDIRAAVERLFPPAPTSAEIAQAKLRLKYRFSEDLTGRAFIAGLTELFVGKQIEIAPEIDKLDAKAIDEAAAAFALDKTFWCIPR
jgi:predicted Zn-dependent peptidase